jgi:alpha-beta hydrolase superfamily lysophospholipase
MMAGRLFMHLTPSLTMESGLNPSGISRNPEEVRRYTDDPLVHSRVSPLFSFPVMAAGEWAIAHASELSIPSLLLHGTADPITDHRATIEFHNRTGLSELELFNGGYHELHHDLCRDGFYKKLGNWLDSRFL